MEKLRQHSMKRVNSIEAMTDFSSHIKSCIFVGRVWKGNCNQWLETTKKNSLRLVVQFVYFFITSNKYSSFTYPIFMMTSYILLLFILLIFRHSIGFRCNNLDQNTLIPDSISSEWPTISYSIILWFLKLVWNKLDSSSVFYLYC